MTVRSAAMACAAHIMPTDKAVSFNVLSISFSLHEQCWLSEGGDWDRLWVLRLTRDAGVSMCIQQRVQRARVLDLPSNGHDVANAQGRIQLGDGLLDEEIGFTGDFQAHAHVVAQVNEFGNTAGEAIDATLAAAVEVHSFGTNRQRDRAAGGADVDRQRFDFFAARQAHHAPIAALAEEGAVDAVVLADKVGDEGVFRLFVEGARWGDLLDL